MLELFAWAVLLLEVTSVCVRVLPLITRFGTYKSSNDTVVYSGQFCYDKMDGQGTYRFTDGRVFTGEWQGGQMHGKGEMMWANNSKYVGGFERNVRSGQGTFTWPDGRVFTGLWRNGKQAQSSETEARAGESP